MSCQTPVALFGFNRPELTAQILAEIRRARPPQLLYVVDGPRSAADDASCEATRRLVREVDWPCKVQTNFAGSNLGCGRRVSSGLNWVFSQVEEAIILEDDCLPCPAFFAFCEAMLARYREDPKVMHISGSSFLGGAFNLNHSYCFSKYAVIWGWATWRRAWRHYDFAIPAWPDFRQRRLRERFPDRIEARHWISRMEPIYKRERQDTWDYQWIFTLWACDALAVMPKENLITNIGAGADATHMKKKSARANLPTGDPGQLKHPADIEIDDAADRIIFDRFFGGARMRQRATLKYQVAAPLRRLRRVVCGKTECA